MAQVFNAKVKNVLNGDTVVLIPSKSTQIPVPERLLTLSYVRSNDSFESREFVRQLLIGKDIKFKVLFKHPTTGKEFGDIKAPIFNSLIEYLLERGIVKLKDNINEDSEFIDNLKDLEAKARAKGEGLWNEGTKSIELISLDESIITKSNKTPITTIVEKVISGDRIIARIIVNKSQHISTPLLLAGIKCPRTDDLGQSKLLTTVAHEAKQYVEDKLLTTKSNMKVSIIGESQARIPIVILEHPSGNNIHEKLLENGYGEIVDWQSTLIGSNTMKLLRRAEQSAKALAKGMFSTGTRAGGNATNGSGSAPVNGGGKISTKHLRPGLTIENATIARVLQADTIIVRLPSSEEVTFQLASIRAPKPSDTTITTNKQHQQALVNSAKEFVRQQAIGKNVTVYIDGFRNANPELGFDSRFLVSIKIGNVDLSELILQKGWASVIKHNKQTSDERSLNWDKLIELEEEQKKLGKNGIYFKGDISKIITVGTRIVDASENLARSKSFFGGFKQKGRISGGYNVDFIPSVNRVKLYNPKEGLKLTLILGGLSNEKTELSEQRLKYMNSKFLQKNVEFEIYDLDKIGGFIGNLYLNNNSLKPIQVQLLEQGYVKVHDIAVGSNPFEQDFLEAEEVAKTNKKGLWANVDIGEVSNMANELQQIKVQEIKPEFHDIEVTYIDPEGIIYYQKLDSNTRNKFNSFKQEFDEFHQQIPSATASSTDLPFNLVKPPKKNELVSVKLEDNGKYYRGKVLSFDKSTNLYEVKHLDYGNIDNVPLSSLRILPSFYGIHAIPVFCHSCKLTFVNLPPSKPVSYSTEALNLMDELTVDKTLVISSLPTKTPNVESEVILYDSEESLKDANYTINKKLVEEGYGIVDETIKSTDKFYVDLLEAQRIAIENHKGCWEYGKISFEDNDI